MPSRGLRDEIRQKRPFAGPEEEAFLNLWRTHSQLACREQRLLKRHGLSMAQYNVLRILRGAGAEGHPIQEIGSRMVAPVPDVSRLVERLCVGELARRQRSSGDRRVVRVSVTTKGKRLLARLDEPIAEFHRRQLGHLTRKQLQQLNELLVAARNGPDEG